MCKPFRETVIAAGARPLRNRFPHALLPPSLTSQCCFTLMVEYSYLGVVFTPALPLLAPSPPRNRRFPTAGLTSQRPAILPGRV
ncbi:unnamed protein product [Periconia digitata]|uniref:Uncharacterized protein n=1 Tax=Periconia digitata TaxID=1303443 RepID=A0A9W4UWK7_9PLEO|nr:unnamed protein product [Periconia digitata]